MTHDNGCQSPTRCQYRVVRDGGRYRVEELSSMGWVRVERRSWPTVKTAWRWIHRQVRIDAAFWRTLEGVTP
jgi:hypothetical protein